MPESNTATVKIAKNIVLVIEKSMFGHYKSAEHDDLAKH